MENVHRISKIETPKGKCASWEITKKELILRIPFTSSSFQEQMVLEYGIPLDELRKALKEKN